MSLSRISLAALAAASLASPARAAQLPLGDFLGQVREGNGGTQGALQAAGAQRDRSGEAQLLLDPTAFATIQYSHDGKPQIVPLSTYYAQDIAQYSLGVSQLTTFGLQAKLSTILYSISYENPGSFLSIFQNDIYDPFIQALGASGAAFPGTINITNQLELTQSLWGNWLGAATRANQDLVEAQARAQSFTNRYVARGTLVDAESAYWKLVTARQTVAITRENLEHAQKTYDWNARRAELQLADQSDALQSEAQLEARHLDYQRALDDEITAARAFNTARGLASDRVEEELAPLSPEAILAMSAPARDEFRDDVKAAFEQRRATAATSRAARERDKPTLELFGTLGLNGQQGDFASTYAQAFSFDHPTAMVGVRFNSPIAFGLAPRIRSAYTREEAAADLTYQRKVFEQEQGWKDLTDRLEQSKRRLKLAVSLERAQLAKVLHERERYRTGRTTAFQVFSFETELTQAQLGRITAESDVLGVLTQMKLYGAEL